MGGRFSGRDCMARYARKPRADETMERLHLPELYREGKMIPGASFTWGFGWFRHSVYDKLFNGLVERLGDDGALRIEVWGPEFIRPGEAGREDLPARLVVTHLWFTGRRREGAPVDVVALDATPCTYGGFRLWCICPDCGERRQTLYVYTKKGQPGVACRTCQGIAYDSQSEREISRSARKAKKLRAKIARGFGFDISLDRPMPPKPKGMHWRTYHRITTDADKAAQVVHDWIAGENAASGVRIERLTDKFVRDCERDDKRERRARRQTVSARGVTNF